jgi:hypothetical protein
MRIPAVALLIMSFYLLHPLTARGSEGLARSRGYSLELIDEAGNILPTFESGGRTYVLGALGKRYSLRVRNGSAQRVEFVASVDGRDVLDGQPSAWEKRGYIVNPYGEVVIDGFRLNEDAVAAFRFSSVKRSYAARMGDARDVGVIGVAVFSERQRVYVAPPHVVGDMRSANESAQGAPQPSVSGLGSAGLSSQSKAESRRGLGTEFGEQRESRVTETEFQRASSSPSVLLSLRYNDCAGLVAMGIEASRGYCPVQGDVQLRQSAEPFRRNSPFSQPPPGWSGS